MKKTDLPFLVFSDAQGNIYTHPDLRTAVGSMSSYMVLAEHEFVRLPKGSSLFYLPGRAPVGFDAEHNRFEVLNEYQGKQVFAVGAFLIPAYLRFHNPATSSVKRSVLPLWAYTACGFHKGKFFVTAARVDKRVRQSPCFYDNKIVARNAASVLKQSPRNRLYRHLAHCALNHNCLAAKNFFLKRWEAPLPTARFCNAGCLGCLSYQDSDCVASHQRISFAPRVAEMVELMRTHLSTAREAIVSFGQGCEGEPLLEADQIAQAIMQTRTQITRGTINMNTNASIPAKIELLCEAGIDSFRVSLSSPVEKYYMRYFRPRGYGFKDVLRSIAIAKKYKKFVSINLFVFPGFTDEETQARALVDFVGYHGIDMIQWRNLNIDADHYKEVLRMRPKRLLGVKNLVLYVQRKFPRLKMGYFNLPKEQF